MQECIAKEGGSSDKFQTLTKISAHGTVEDVRIYWNGPAAVCVYQKLHQWQQKKSVEFSRPPHDEYWVRLDLDASEFSAQGSK